MEYVRPVQRSGLKRSAAIVGCVVLAGLLSSACGGDDVTTFTSPEEDATPSEPEPAPSRTLEVLSERTSLDVVCRWIGVSSVAGTGAAGNSAACSAVVDDCRAGVEDVLGSGDGPAVSLPPVDLEGLFGCPLTLPELDGCIGAALERGVDQFGAIDCDMPAPPPLSTFALFASAECLGVALRCPELLAGLAGQ